MRSNLSPVRDRVMVSELEDITEEDKKGVFKNETGWIWNYGS
jgi:hypothetical protein